MEDTLRALRAMAEMTRLRLLSLFLRGEFTVSELVGMLGQSQPRVSRHLKILCDAGLIERAPEGSWVFYRLSQDRRQVRLIRQILGQIPYDDSTIRRDIESLERVKEDRNQAAAEYFRKNASQWDKIRTLHVDEQVVDNAVISMMPESASDTLLDIGTGTGHMLKLLGGRFERAEGVDLSHEMLALARANLADEGFDNCGVRSADMYQLPHDPESFDAAVIHQVLHFSDSPTLVIAEAARVLRPGGHVLLVDFAPHDVESLRDEFQHRRLGFDDSEISQLCAAHDLSLTDTRRLPGDPLTVMIWLATKSTTPKPNRDLLGSQSVLTA